MAQRSFIGPVTVNGSALASGRIVVEQTEGPSAGQSFVFIVTAGEISAIGGAGATLEAPANYRFVLRYNGLDKTTFDAGVSNVGDPLTWAFALQNGTLLPNTTPEIVREGDSVTRLSGNGTTGQIPVQQEDGSLAMTTVDGVGGGVTLPIAQSDVTGLASALAAKATPADITTAVSAEATARATAVSAEATTRAAADTALDARVDTLETTATDHESRIDAIEALPPGDGAVASVNGQTGVVVLDAGDVGAAEAVHTHTLSQITDAGTAASRNVAASGDASSTEVVKGNDSRLNDSRTPTAHATSHKSGGSDAIRLNELSAPTAAVALNAQKITGLADPTSDQDAATKKYVDDNAGGGGETVGADELEHFRLHAALMEPHCVKRVDDMLVADAVLVDLAEGEVIYATDGWNCYIESIDAPGRIEWRNPASGFGRLRGPLVIKGRGVGSYICFVDVNGVQVPNAVAYSNSKNEYYRKRSGIHTLPQQIAQTTLENGNTDEVYVNAVPVLLGEHGGMLEDVLVFDAVWIRYTNEQGDHALSAPGTGDTTPISQVLRWTETFWLLPVPVSKATLWQINTGQDYRFNAGDGNTPTGNLKWVNCPASWAGGNVKDPHAPNGYARSVDLIGRTSIGAPTSTSFPADISVTAGVEIFQDWFKVTGAGAVNRGWVDTVGFGVEIDGTIWWRIYVPPTSTGLLYMGGVRKTTGTPTAYLTDLGAGFYINAGGAIQVVVDTGSGSALKTQNTHDEDGVVLGGGPVNIWTNRIANHVIAGNYYQLFATPKSNGRWRMALQSTAPLLATPIDGPDKIIVVHENEFGTPGSGSHPATLYVGDLGWSADPYLRSGHAVVANA